MAVDDQLSKMYSKRMVMYGSEHRWVSDDEPFEEHLAISDHTEIFKLQQPSGAVLETQQVRRRKRNLRGFLRRCADSVEKTCARICCRDGYLIDEDEYQVHHSSILSKHGIITPTASVYRSDSFPSVKEPFISPDSFGKRGGFYDGTFPLTDDDLWHAAQLHQCGDVVNNDSCEDDEAALNPYDTPSMKQIYRSMWTLRSDVSSPDGRSSFICGTPLSSFSRRGANNAGPDHRSA